MFFPDKIKSIQSHYKVLEIGPGATPHPRSDVFLEKKFSTEQELIAQSGHVGLLKTNKKIVTYSGDVFPFKDNEFDYVICSHVLEHVENIEIFISEVFRVAPRGYFEFPTLYYDYILNIPEHTTFLNFKEDTLHWMLKSESGLNAFKDIQELFYMSFFKEYGNVLIPLYLEYLMQGFEWNAPFKLHKSASFNDFILPKKNLDEIKITDKIIVNKSYHENPGIKNSFKLLLKSILYKISK